MKTIVLKSGSQLYRVESVPFEPLADTYARGWFIIERVQQADSDKPAEITDEIIQASFEWLYKKKGLVY